MQDDQLKARVRKRFTCTTMSDHDQPVAANVLDREFTADAPNRRWVGDTTEFVIGESGKLYLAAILDLFSRFVVGWAISAVNDRYLTLKALDDGIEAALSRARATASFRPGLHRTPAKIISAGSTRTASRADEPGRGQQSRGAENGRRLDGSAQKRQWTRTDVRSTLLISSPMEP